MNNHFQVSGDNDAAKFTLKLHRGEGMTLIAMNWKKGRPPLDFVGFGIEYKEPGGDRFYPVKNRLSFPGNGRNLKAGTLSSLLSPVQKFRWVHFPRNAELPGRFIYKVTPVFMNEADELSYGEAQEAAIELRRETYPGQLNIAFTRGFVSSQAFSGLCEAKGFSIDDLMPPCAAKGLKFAPVRKGADELLAWMGFEARREILCILDQAIADKTAQVRVVAYDLNLPEIVSRLEALKGRLKIIIDNSATHHIRNNSGKAKTCAEDEAAARLTATAGEGNVMRQKMGCFQHNKTIVVNGSKIQAVVCGSTNFSWRGFFVQANNALVLYGKSAVDIFQAAFEEYWKNAPGIFKNSGAAQWQDILLKDVDTKVTFSPHAAPQWAMKTITVDLADNVSSTLFYSLAFMSQLDKSFLEEIARITKGGRIFGYGVSENRVKDVQLTKPDGTSSAASYAALTVDIPDCFLRELSGKPGIRMHHKFIVIDFDKPTARVYLGSHNFSKTADDANGDNLLLIRDRRVAVSYAVEALRIFDHYHFRMNWLEAKRKKKELVLVKPPRSPEEKPWWDEYYRVKIKIRDREIFA